LSFPRYKLILFFSLFFTSSLNAQVSQNFLKDEQPQYELGAGFIMLNVPDYPGSDNNRFRVVPFPYYIYRGKYLRADDEGTRARLFSSKYHETGLSLSFNFPVRSGNNLARSGIPDLDALAGFGPRFLFRLMTDQTHRRLNFSISTRTMFSYDLGTRFKTQGLSVQPSLNYWQKFFGTDTTFFSSMSLEVASAELHQFFYQVDDQYQNPSRPSYHARAGLMETSISAGFGQNLWDDIFVFLAGSWRNLDWAQNRDSPLVASRNNTAIVFGLVWTFYESEAKVQRLESQIL
jgi:MipA family protein